MDRATDWSVTDQPLLRKTSDSETRHDRLRLVFGIVGTALSLTLVLAPLGLPLVWLAYRHRLASRDAGPAAGPTGLNAVLRRHLGLLPPKDSSR